MRYIRIKGDIIIDVEKRLQREKEEYNKKYGSFYKISGFKLKQIDDQLVAIPVDEKGHKIRDKNIKSRIFFSVWVDDIVKQADTLEELCDEFVVVIKPDNGKEYGFLASSYTEMKNLERYPENGYYGAIWTDKGLIYVAKMNDKGELELL